MLPFDFDGFWHERSIQVPKVQVLLHLFQAILCGDRTEMCALHGPYICLWRLRSLKCRQILGGYSCLLCVSVGLLGLSLDATLW